jgi:hypothetical protein
LHTETREVRLTQLPEHRQLQQRCITLVAAAQVAVRQFQRLPQAQVGMAFKAVEAAAAVQR